MKSNQNIILEKSFKFALDIIVIYKYLKKEQKEFVLSKQLLRSGTSIGANIHESLSAESRIDFVHKLSISLKEARETDYWLRLLYESQYIDNNIYTSANNKLTEILRLLKSIILTSKQRYNLK